MDAKVPPTNHQECNQVSITNGEPQRNDRMKSDLAKHEETAYLH